jgi:hypothetical protein
MGGKTKKNKNKTNTIRIVLEVTYDTVKSPHPSQWDWNDILDRALFDNENVKYIDTVNSPNTDFDDYLDDRTSNSHW